MKEVYDVPYMERTREYYKAQGYKEFYRWAQHQETPFTKLAKPVGESRIGLITTAMPDTKNGRENRGVYSTPTSPPPDSMYTQELSWHKAVTHTNDVASFLPINQLINLRDAGKIKGLTSRFYSLPTDYSQRNTNERDAPEILNRLIEDKADIAILVPL